MCGIVGYMGPWPEELIEKMVGSLAHRGPDGQGVYLDDSCNVALGHTRLSIIDLSDNAAQPMFSEDGRYILTFNGEIYNYVALRRSLESVGVSFKAHSDTEVLLHLYMREGESCLQKLHGIFAFAIWDQKEKRLFIARDQIGVKPLYYAEIDKGFLFSSELKSLVLCPDVKRDIDPIAVADHLGFLWTAGESTMIRKIKKLRPGCYMKVDSSGVKIERYYRVPTVSHGLPGSDADLRNLIDEVVGEQMVSDVEVGALLSGGVDSSAIVASMCRVMPPDQITTFCASVQAAEAGADNFGDDEKFAKRVAAHFGVNLVEVATDVDVIDMLESMVWSLDEPTADFSALQTRFLARAARQKGVKVLLSGVGGDDLFTGYGRHTAALFYQQINSLGVLRKVLGQMLALVPAGTLMGRRVKRIGELLSRDEESMIVDAMSFSGVKSDQRMRLVHRSHWHELPESGVSPNVLRSLEATKQLHPVERILDLEMLGFLPDHNLNYTDKMAMLEGIEVRVPLCDPRLVEYARSLPLSDLISLNSTKKILRKSQSNRLPEEVLQRPKQGFGVPVRSWLKGPARPLLEELTSKSAVEDRMLFDADEVDRLRRDFYEDRVDGAMTLFPLMAIEAWCRKLDNTPQLNLSG